MSSVTGPATIPSGGLTVNSKKRRMRSEEGKERKKGGEETRSAEKSIVERKQPRVSQ